VVKEEQSGWLAIRPPADSFDWIDARAVTREGPYAAVQTDGVHVLIGSRLRQEMPDVQGARLVRGTQLVVVGAPFTPPGGITWLPIQPPPQEFRYIPATAVKTTGPVQALTTPLAATPPAPPPIGSVAVPPTTGAVASNTMPAAAPPPSNRVYSQYGPAPTNFAPLPGTGAAAAPLLPSSPTGPAAQWSGPGRLYRTSFALNGQVAYGLLSSRNQVLLYITPPPGQSLDPYAERNVNVYGPVLYHGELRKHHMTAQQVQLLP
jgi:hypothetical protein